MLCVAAGEGWVAVATSTNYLRIFTSWGIQREIISLPGSSISMVGLRNRLFLVSHCAHPLPGQQNLVYHTLDMNFRNGLSSITGPLPLPLTPSCELNWVGLTDKLLPVTTDSRGVVRMLANGGWYPICDMRDHLKGKSEAFWVTSVHQNYQHIRGIKCRGSTCPQTIPKPSITTTPFQAPICSSGDQGLLEQKLAASSLIRTGCERDDDVTTQALQEELECLMKLFALACR